MSIAVNRALPTLDVAAPTADAGTDAAWPAVLKDAQGREFRLQADPLTGLPQYRHAGQQRDQAGNQLDVEILISFGADGSTTRRTTQHLLRATGASEREVATSTFDATGKQTGDLLEATTVNGASTLTERTVGEFANGVQIRRTTDFQRRDEQTDATTKEHIVATVRLRAVWDGKGGAVTDATVPSVERTDTEQYTSPGQGINKDTPRTISFEKRGTGTLEKIDWEPSAKLVVRFHGRGEQYIERELAVPVGADGTPDMNNTTVVRDDNKESLLNKGMMQARIWGGFASNLAWIGAVNFTSGGLRAGLLGVSALTAAAQFGGEAHALATRRNDGDWARLASSGYDLLLTGLLTAYMTGRGRSLMSSMPPSARIGGAVLGVAGLSMNGAEALNSRLGVNGLQPGTLGSIGTRTSAAIQLRSVSAGLEPLPVALIG